MIKTILYTICKNEENRIEKWLDCYRDVDVIVVVDTGSEDKSVELLKRDPKVNVIEKTWDPFNFAAARNFALEKAREIADREPDVNWIFLCFDFDEYLEKDSINILKEEWAQGDYSRAIVKCTMPNGSDAYSHFSRVHAYDKNWVWGNPVHEGLFWKGENEEDVKDLQSTITYFHDWEFTPEKAAFYNYLIEIWEEKDPENIYLKNFLIDLLLSRGENEKCIKKCKELKELVDGKFASFDNYLAFFHATYTLGKLDPKEELKGLLRLCELAEDRNRTGEYKSRRIYLELATYYLTKMKPLTINKKEGVEYLKKAVNMNTNTKYYYPFVDEVNISRQQIQELIFNLNKSMNEI